MLKRKPKMPEQEKSACQASIERDNAVIARILESMNDRTPPPERKKKV